MAHTSLAGSKASGAAAGPIVQFRAANAARDVRVFEIGVFAATAVAGEVGIVVPSGGALVIWQYSALAVTYDFHIFIDE
jgi:hypothetical protein